MIRNKKFRKAGFTLIELLIVIAIIGILAAVVLVNLNSGRSKSRDVKRVADVRQIVSALHVFYNDNSGYPAPDIESLTGPDPGTGDPTWSTYLINWPQAPIPADNPEGDTTCNSAGLGTGNNQYAYTQLDAGNDFSITFCLGGSVDQYGPGVHTATSSGIQ